MTTEITGFLKWYEKTYSGPDGDFSGIPDWHKDDMWEAWCAGLSYADQKGQVDADKKIDGAVTWKSMT